MPQKRTDPTPSENDVEESKSEENCGREYRKEIDVPMSHADVSQSEQTIIFVHSRDISEDLHRVIWCSEVKRIDSIIDRIMTRLGLALAVILIVPVASQFVYDPTSDDSAEVQAMMFCAIHADDIDSCAERLVASLHEQAPQPQTRTRREDGGPSREENKDDHRENEESRKLNFALKPGQDPVHETDTFCRRNVLSKDVEWCQRRLLEQIYAQAPHLRPKKKWNDRPEEHGGSSSTRHVFPKAKNVARGKSVYVDSDEFGNIAAVVDGCKSDCWISWTSDPQSSNAIITLDLGEPHCVRAARLYWFDHFSPGTVKIRDELSSFKPVYAEAGLPDVSFRNDTFRLVPKRQSGGIDVDRFLYFDFSEKHAEDFDLTELQVFGYPGKCSSVFSSREKDGRHDSVIVVIAYDRPKYFRRVMHSLSKCEGIDRHAVHVFIDPSDVTPEMESIALSFASNKANRYVTVRTSRLGPHANKRLALKHAFDTHNASFAMLLEDDVILARDALLFMEYARRTYAHDDSVFTVTGYANNCKKEGCTIASVFHNALGRRRHYTPWFWGTWRNRWIEIMEAGWSGWDVEMNFALDAKRNIRNSDIDRGLRRDRYEIFPVLSRSNNIGFENGFHSHSFTPEQMKAMHYIHCWAQSCGGEVDDEVVVDSFFEINSLGPVVDSFHLACTSHEGRGGALSSS